MSRISLTGLRFVSLRFVSMDARDDDAAALLFRPRRPLGFRAGQHGLWLVPGGGLAPFTVASAPGEELVMLGTSLRSGSRMKRALAALTPGSTVRLLGPLSGFTMDPTAPSVVMLAQGIGVTPFRAMLRHAAVTASASVTATASASAPSTAAGQRTILVHVGGRHPFRSDTENDATEAAYPTDRAAFARHVTDTVARRPDATFMVSGSPAFVRSTVTLLRANAVDTSRIARDSFFGYSPDRRNAVPPAASVPTG